MIESMSLRYQTVIEMIIANIDVSESCIMSSLCNTKGLSIY